MSEDSVRSIEQILERDGTLALPHYIHREVEPADRDDYQTVYAAQPGAIAAPTAGLHFTDELFSRARRGGRAHGVRNPAYRAGNVCAAARR